MKMMDVHGTEIDSCPKCAGVFLDAHEGGVINVDTGMLFGFGARPVGKSERLCPDHNVAMMTFRVATPSSDEDINIERSECCGGVYLDAGEGYAMAQGAPARPLKPADRPEKLACPACSATLTLQPFHEVTVDECTACASMFLGPGEAELSNIDTEALFDDAPWAAPKEGPSNLSCPECDKAMVFYKPGLLGASVDVHSAECCGGVWMKRADEVVVRSASRFAVGERADAQFMAGKEIQQSAASLTKADIEARRAAGARYAAAAAADRQARMILSTVRTYQRGYQRRY
ncbi:MAG: Zn-finger nucleic acid-binding protein [Polyangiales bacterium]|jgi:Zn-finger nucleic acid-binding protein